MVAYLVQNTIWSAYDIKEFFSKSQGTNSKNKTTAKKEYKYQMAATTINAVGLEDLDPMAKNYGDMQLHSKETGGSHREVG